MTDQPTTETRGPIDYARRQQAERAAEVAPAGPREQYAAAIHKALRDYGEGDDDPGTGSDYGDQTAAVLAVRDTEMQQLREQLAARDAALAACTAQLVHDQAALARVRAAADQIHRAVLNANGEPLTAYDRGVDTAVRRILAALQPPAPANEMPVSTCARTDQHGYHMWPQKPGKPAFCPGHPAPDGGPTVAEAAADDRVWPLQREGE